MRRKSEMLQKPDEIGSSCRRGRGAERGTDVVAEMTVCWAGVETEATEQLSPI